MKRIFVILMVAAVWLASAIENQFLTAPWADWLCVSLVVLLWIGAAYILWREGDKSRRQERKRMRTSQRMADEENRRAYLQETMAA